MNVAVFPPARSRDSRTNLDEFIAKGRASAAFGKVDWDAAVWPNVDTKVKKRITAGKQSESLNFLLHGGERGTADKSPIPQPMCDFAKALVRIREATKPTAIENHRVVIRAVRLLVRAFDGQEPDPCMLLPHHFDEAANIARREQSALTAYATGKALGIVADMLRSYNITRVRIDWSNTVPRPHSQDRVTDEAKESREKRLPSQAALAALPEMSNMVSEDDDVLRMRTIELFVCGGWRLNELLTIPADCEVEELQADGTVRYGIRYRAEKGFEHSVKWIPSVLVETAKRAVADISVSLIRFGQTPGGWPITPEW